MDKKVSMALNNIEQLLKLVSNTTEYMSISDFALLVGIPIGITGCAVGLKLFAINCKN